MDDTLARRLNELLRRLRLFHALWRFAIVWIVFAGLGYWMWSHGKQGDGVPTILFQAWIAGVVLASVASCWLAWRSFRNLASVAKLIERRYPALNQRLTTATELRPVGEDGNFSFLQRSVIAEALNHDVKNRWWTIVPSGRLLALGLANVPALLAVCGIGWALWRSPQNDSIPLLGSIVQPNSEILAPEVVPGDTEVKKGSSLIVTAKFPGKLPTQVFLIRKPQAIGPEKSSEKLLMKQSLGDPLFAAYIHDIREPLDYFIEYDSQASTNYSVAVFECPEVVRADAKLSYPLYTGMDAKEIVDTRRVSAPIGSTLTWQLHLTKPIVKAVLVPKPTRGGANGEQSQGESIELQIDQDNSLLASCEIEVKQSAEWQVQLTDADGRQNEVAVTLKLNALANKEPTLQLTAGGDATVSALQEFEVAAKVKDDYAITAAGIGYQLAGGELIERPLEIRRNTEKNKKESTLSEMIDFESLKAQPDELLSYYVWVEDLNENGKPRRISSDIFFAEVRPFEEIFRQGDQSADQQQQQQQQGQGQGQQQQGGAGEELLELQKQIISASWNIARAANSKNLPQRSAEDLKVVLDSQQQAIEMLQEQAAEAPEGSQAAVAQAEKAMNLAADKLAAASSSLTKSDLAQAISAEQQAYQSLLKLQPRESQVSRQRSQQSSQQSRRQQSRQQQLDQLDLDEERENRYQDERRAQEEQQSPESETRQVASRLRELAMRQQDLNQQLRDVEAALQSAESKEEREELEQRLERLRQQQQQILEDADELQQRMQENQNSEMQQAQEQLEQTRENLQQANQALRENNTGQALAAGARAEEQLEQLREDVREQAANQFGETMQEMRTSADELQQRQQQLVEKLQPKDEKPSTGLRDAAQEQDGQARELAKDQQEQLSELLNRMQETIEQAEESEPLLAQKLFDGYRRTQEEQVDKQLELTNRLLERDFNKEAGQLAGETLEDLKKLSQDIGEASKSVLGSDLESMRLALDQLDVARQQIEGEIARANGQASDSQPDPNQQANNADQQANSDNPRSGQSDQQEQQQQQQQTDRQQQQAEQQPGQQPSDQQPGGQPGQRNQQQSGQQQQGQPGLRGNDQQQEPGERPDDDSRPGLLGGGGGLERNWRDAAPITGEDFRVWSDRLRDVEELVTDPDLRWEATRIRQAARQLRTDWQRTSKAPRWSDVEDLVANPIRDLQRKLSQELMRRAAEQTDIVPVDRDPVPAQYRDLVREYYERLGKGK